MSALVPVLTSDSPITNMLYYAPRGWMIYANQRGLVSVHAAEGLGVHTPLIAQPAPSPISGGMAHNRRGVLASGAVNGDILLWDLDRLGEGADSIRTIKAAGRWGRGSSHAPPRARGFLVTLLRSHLHSLLPLSLCHGQSDPPPSRTRALTARATCWPPHPR